MKNKVILILAILLVFTLSACGGDDTYYEEDIYEPTTRDKLEEMDWSDIMEYVVQEIPFEDMVEYYGEETLNSYLYDPPLCPNMYLIVDDLEYLGLYDEIRELYRIADKAGHYPSAILGEYFMDESTSVIHATDGDCLNNMRIEDRQVVSCSSRTLRKELNDGDIYLEGCTLCPDCIGH